MTVHLDTHDFTAIVLSRSNLHNAAVYDFVAKCAHPSLHAVQVKSNVTVLSGGRHWLPWPLTVRKSPKSTHPPAHSHIARRREGTEPFEQENAEDCIAVTLRSVDCFFRFWTKFTPVKHSLLIGKFSETKANVLMFVISSIFHFVVAEAKS